MSASPALPTPVQRRDDASLLLRLHSAVERLDWRGVFAQALPVEIELGSGDGSFLVEWARRNPERNYLGVERLAGRMRKLDRKGRRAGLGNLVGLRIEAGYFTEYLVPPASVAAFHVYFPDPWPKARHAANRLIQPRFVGVLRQSLVIGGAVYLRTDHADYFAQMRACFGTDQHFAEVETPAALVAVPTDFEREFSARGLPTHRAAFVRLR